MRHAKVIGPSVILCHVKSIHVMSCHAMLGFGYGKPFWLLFIDDAAAVSISDHAESTYVTTNGLYSFLSYFCHECDLYLMIM